MKIKVVHEFDPFFQHILEGKFMARIDEITAKLDKIELTMAAEHEEVVAAVGDMQSTIVDLRTQLEGMLSDADFAMVSTRLDTINDKASHIYEAVTTPPAPDEPVA